MAGMMRKGEGGGGRGREGEGEGLYLYHYRGWIEQGMKQFTGSPLPYSQLFDSDLASMFHGNLCYVNYSPYF